MLTSTRRRLVRVQLTTLSHLMQQASAHWEQVDQALYTDELRLERLQQRLKALHWILACEPSPPECCTALVSKVQTLARQEECLRTRIALERARCQLLEQVFDDAQRAQSIFRKQWQKAHHRGRQQFQLLLREMLTQMQHAAASFALEMPSSMLPPI